MPTLIKDLAIIEDNWTLIESNQNVSAILSQDQTILPWDFLVKHGNHFDRIQHLGVWVDTDAQVEDVLPYLSRLDLIAVRFPGFADGRGLSFAALLRSRYGFGGELRAFGDIIPDLGQYLHRSGFDAFVVRNRVDAVLALKMIASITDHYQASIRQPLPAFRRSSF
jgi:uncharacterized protein (DUF934 family)